MVRLASVEFTKLKNVRPGTRLVFPEAGAVLLGKNGTGKTTLLQHLVALCTADLDAFVSDEPFDVSATFRFGSGATATLQLTGTPRSQSIPVPEGSSGFARKLSSLARTLSSGENTRLEYMIRSRDESTSYKVSVIDGRAELYRNDQSLCSPFLIPTSRVMLTSCLFKLVNLISQSTGVQASSILSVAIEIYKLQEAFIRYDEGLDYLGMLTAENSSYLSMEAKLNDGKDAIREIRGPVNRIPDDLRTALTNGQSLNASLEYLSVPHSVVGFMRDFVRLCGLSGATVIVPIEERRSGRETILNWKRLRFTFELAGNRISHAKLSFGQKRLLSYLYYLACNRQIGIADELVNGMHHEWIDHCLGDACAGRQMFYTSQNPLLLDFLTFESEAEVSERLITCKWNETDGFVWENLEPRIGEEFYRLYKAGIQHVSEILRTKGWW